MNKIKLMETLNDKNISYMNILFNTDTKQGLFLLGTIFASNKKIDIDMNKIDKASLFYSMLEIWKKSKRKDINCSNDIDTYHIMNNNDYSYYDCVNKLEKIANSKNIFLHYDRNNKSLFFELGMVYYYMYNNSEKHFNIDNFDYDIKDAGDIIINDLCSLNVSNKKKILKLGNQ